VNINHRTSRTKEGGEKEVRRPTTTFLALIGLLTFCGSSFGLIDSAGWTAGPHVVSFAAAAATKAPPTAGDLTAGDVETIIAQAAAQAQAVGFKATIAVVDAEGNVLGTFKMAGAPDSTLVGKMPEIGNSKPPVAGPQGHGLEDVSVPSRFAAVSKAGTGAFLSSQGEAFSTRTASFIIQEHFPPGVMFTSSGPLSGVQFSSLFCSDVLNPPPPAPQPTLPRGLPLGLSADPGGLPLYKNGRRAGGIGVEGDGHYGLALSPSDLYPAGSPNDQPVEEQVALAGTRGFEAPSDITANNIVVNGIRFPFVNTPMPPPVSVPPLAGLGSVINFANGASEPISSIQGAQTSIFRTVTVDGIAGRLFIPLFPKGQPFPQATPNGDVLTANDVLTLLVQAAKQCLITRAAIRMPLGSAAQVNITVVDQDGAVLGIFSLPDAPVFGFDVSSQKARTAAFISSAGAGAALTAAGQTANEGGLAAYRAAALADGLKLDGSVAFTDRAGGFLSRPFFPDGIDGTQNGPFSKAISIWSPFNDGLQEDLLLNYVINALTPVKDGGPIITKTCTAIPAANGIQIFPGSVPLYKNGVLVGGIGVSGDGVDQDDLIATMGSAGFEAPDKIRSDEVFVRGVRLPYVKFPRHPDLP
jgi:uncharacterized protein GlcG (DUF336 family)